MDELYKLKEMLCKELEEYGSKGELTGGTLEVVDKLAHALKNLDKIIEAKEMSEEGSYDGSYEGGMSGARGRGRSYAGGSMAYGDGSYARGRGRNARRDSMGRYSGRRGYSRDGETDQYVQQLEEMMQELPQGAKQHIQKAIQEMEQM